MCLPRWQAAHEHTTHAHRAREEARGPSRHDRVAFYRFQPVQLHTIMVSGGRGHGWAGSMARGSDAPSRGFMRVEDLNDIRLPGIEVSWRSISAMSLVTVGPIWSR